MSIVVAVFILPALAATDVPIPPASGAGVTPTVVSTGGQSNDCALFGSTGYQYRIDNPQTGPYQVTAPDGRPVTFTLTVQRTGKEKDKFFDFTISGASTSHVGVKGGSETAHYDYAASTVGPVTSDTRLHATLDNQGKLYNLSNVTFCYSTGAAVSGRVFDDANGDGVKDAAETTGPAGLTVTLSDGSSNPPTTTTGQGGAYSFGNRPIGVAYRVCAAAPTGSWVQTLPNGQTSGSTACSGVGQSALGYSFTLSAAGRTNLDFGNVQVASISGMAFVDANDNGVKDGGEAGQSGLTVTLSDGTSNPPTDITDVNGSYSFAGRLVGVAYTVCASAPSGDWAQTLPNGQTSGSTACSGVGQSALGYSVTLSAAGRTNLDFGNVATVGLCTAPFGLPGEYEIHLAEPCKQGQRFVVTYSDAGSKLASVRPVNTGLLPVPMVEKITWTIPGNQQNQLTMIYDDTLPYGTGTGEPKTMLYCNVDPRVSGSEFGLSTAYDAFSESGAVMPTASDTSCLISTTESAPATVGGLKRYTAYVYSSIDGWRSTT